MAFAVGEEGLEDPGPDLIGDTAAGVRESDSKHAVHLLRPDSQRPAVLHRVGGVAGQVVEHADHFLHVHRALPGEPEIAHDVDVPFDEVLFDEREGPLHDVFEDDRLEVDLAHSAGEVKDLLRHVDEPVDLPYHLVGEPGGLRIPGLLLDHLRVHAQRPHRVLDVVDDRACHLPHGGEPLALDHLAGEPGVLQGDRGVDGERVDERLVLGEERSLPLVQELEDAEDLPVLVPHRHAEDIARLVAAFLVDLGVEPGVFVRIGDVDDLAGLGHVARESLPDREADLDDVVSLCHP